MNSSFVGFYYNVSLTETCLVGLALVPHETNYRLTFFVDNGLLKLLIGNNTIVIVGIWLEDDTLTARIEHHGTISQQRSTDMGAALRGKSMHIAESELSKSKTV